VVAEAPAQVEQLFERSAGGASLVAAVTPSPPAACTPLEPAIEREVGTQLAGPPVDAQVAELPRPTLIAYALGAFRVIFNDRPVESWPSGRGRAVLKYLLAQHGRPVPRDVLMDVFWPDSGPELARNSLNVALHGLRQAFRAVHDLPVLIFENGAYRLNPELSIWLDVEEFEHRFQLAQRLERGGQISGASAEYEVAVSLYRDDFLLDDPYEDWAVLTRERLRLLLFEALDRLSQIYFSQGRYAACASLCQQILGRDSCREDAHRRLMRCYARQGQHPLALRQYQSCVEALRAELEVEPSPSTAELAERIRRREPV
jgi:DNA-binding SARP family transcriptional activator